MSALRFLKGYGNDDDDDKPAARGSKRPTPTLQPTMAKKARSSSAVETPRVSILASSATLAASTSMNAGTAQTTITTSTNSTQQQQTSLPPPPPPVMSYGNCRSIDHYERDCIIGSGTYGVVFKAFEKTTRAVVAIKKIRMERETTGMPITCLREIKLLSTLKHPYIVDLKEVAVGPNPKSVFLVFEYCEHDLASLVDTVKAPFSESAVKRLTMQLLAGVAFLHSKHILHRDLKLSNLLYTARGRLKLADFGLGRRSGQHREQLTPTVVTLWYDRVALRISKQHSTRRYRAPELLLGETRYGAGVDLWAVGCIVGELLVHAPLLPAQTELEQIRLMCALLGAPSERLWPGVSRLPNFALLSSWSESRFNHVREKIPSLTDNGYDLFFRLLTYDPAKRISADECLQHPYLFERPLPQNEALMPTFNSTHARRADTDEDF